MAIISARRIFDPEDRRRWMIILAVLAFDLALLPVATFTLEWLSFVPALAAAAGMLVIGGVYRLSGRSEPIAAMTMATAALLVFSLLAGLGNYLAAGLSRPLIDGHLAAVDAALGFHWPTATAAVQALPGLKDVLSLAYLSSLPQIAAAVIVLGFAGHLRRLNVFVMALICGALATVAFWTVFPSFGALAYYQAAGLPVDDTRLVVDSAYASELIALHEGRLAVLSVDQMKGLIAFPSFHTVLAVLTMYALFPVRFVGPLAIGLNLLVIASVPFDGGHHLVDVPAGLAVAAAALFAAERLVAGERRAAAPTPSLSKPRPQPTH